MSHAASPILDQLRARAKNFYDAGNFTEAAVAYRGIMEIVPSDFDAIHQLGLVAFQLGHLEESRKLLQGALNLRPDDSETWLHHGMALQKQCRPDDAVASYEQALSLRPDYSEAVFCIAMTQKEAGRAPEALASFSRFIGLRGDIFTAFVHRGDLLRDKGDFDASLADYESALNLRPDFFDAWLHRGVLLAENGRAEDALASYDKAIAVAPDRSEAWYNRGVALQDLGRDEEALEANARSLQLDPNFPDAWNNRGALLRKMGKMEEALASFEQALKRDPRHIQSLNNQADALIELRRFDEALACYDRVLQAAPDSAEGWMHRGIALQSSVRYPEAIAAYEKAVKLNPQLNVAWNNLGTVLREEGKYEKAMAAFAEALQIDPRHADTLANTGACLQDLKRFAEATREFRKLEMVAPGHKYLVGGLALSALTLCDWPVLESLKARLEAEVMSGKSVLPPFSLLGLSDDPALHRSGAYHFLREFPARVQGLPRPRPVAHDKIRLAYVSNDFHAHATARLMSDLFERHDRARFEVIAISFGPDEQGPVRTRLKKAFDQFHDVREMTDEDVAALMKRLEVDIAIDLKGYTERARPGIFIHRPAPVLVNYLGYPGTLAADFMDYVIADPVALPMDQQDFYSERIVHLPDSYQVNDPKRAIGPRPTRAEAGLPESGFVFANFNNQWKITAPVFDVWMRLLEAVPGSVLWLLDDSANANLKRAAKAQGIAPERLILAPRIEHDAHLGRLGLADLVLDTLPYNAHTTGSDALWTGVPLVTLRGKAFAGRVAASLLTAIGLPELITDDLEAYEKLAKSLAKSPKKLEALKAKLEKNRLTTPLFDAERFCRNIESAFTTMAEAAQRGEEPKAFAVPE